MPLELVVGFSVGMLIISITVFFNNKKNKNKFGKIQCKRCQHIGYSKIIIKPFRGQFAVCSKCRGEDWTVYSPEKLQSKNMRKKEDNGKQCPSCAERVKGEASQCRFCGHIFSTNKNKAIESTDEIKNNSITKHSNIENIVSPNEEHKVMERAKMLIKKNRYHDAIKVLSQSMSVNSNQSEAYYFRAVAYSKIQERKKAISDLKKSATLGNKKAIKYLQDNPRHEDNQDNPEGQDV